MVETIFKTIIIIMMITIVFAVIGNLSISYNLSISSYVSVLTSFLSVVFYIIPFKKLLPIFVIVIAFSVFRIAISILKTIWSILPIN